MSVFSRPALHTSAIGGKDSPVGSLILVRAACADGATRAQLVRDLGPISAAKLSPADWRNSANAELSRLLAAGLVHDQRGRFRTTPAGAAAAARYLGEKDGHAREWSEQRDIWLVAKALGVDAGKPGVYKALARPDGLSALIVQKAFGLSMRQALSPSKLRAALALVALERAFGDTIKSGLNSGSALSAKAGRVLAGQLLRSPREYATDARLIAALSAEQAGAAKTDIDVLRSALLRSLAGPAPGPAARAAPAPKADRPARAASGEAAPPVAAKVAQRPGLTQFSAGVLTAARSHAEGWPGSRKAFISQVWQAIRASHPEWGLSEIEFKDMLAGAHRAGQLLLTSADLKNKQNIKDFEESAIFYKNTVWHFVRVED